MKPIRVAVTGLHGRMGSVVAKLVRENAAFTFAGGTERAGVTAPEISSRLDDVVANCDVVIDFTSAEASVVHANVCMNAKVPIVIGSTGFSAVEKTRLAECARVIPVLAAPNMSIGVNVMIRAAAELARQLGSSFDVDIVETHHRMKKDAPSGTALRLAEEVASALGRGTDQIRTTRAGQIGERSKTEIGVQTLRGGDVVGEHTVFFFGDGERLELTHRATNRDQFARGALRAAQWILGKPPGLYDMSHVLKG